MSQYIWFWGLGFKKKKIVYVAGIDFQVKPLLVGDSLAVLQLWDTAGQER